MDFPFISYPALNFLYGPMFDNSEESNMNAFTRMMAREFGSSKNEDEAGIEPRTSYE